MVQEKYTVRLSAEDRDQLRGLIRSGQHSARVINRARILLKTDEGWSASRVAVALDTSPRTVFRTKRRYSEAGLDGVLHDHPQANRYRKLDDRGEAHLIALAYIDAPEGHDRRQLVLPVATTIFAGRDGVIIRYGGTVDYRPTSQAIEAETYGRQDTGNGSGQGWDERAFSAQVAEWAIAVAGETGASVAHSAGSLRRGVGG